MQLRNSSQGVSAWLGSTTQSTTSQRSVDPVADRQLHGPSRSQLSASSRSQHLVPSGSQPCLQSQSSNNDYSQHFGGSTEIQKMNSQERAVSQPITEFARNPIQWTSSSSENLSATVSYKFVHALIDVLQSYDSRAVTTMRFGGATQSPSERNFSPVGSFGGRNSAFSRPVSVIPPMVSESVN